MKILTIKTFMLRRLVGIGALALLIVIGRWDPSRVILGGSSSSVVDMRLALLLFALLGTMLHNQAAIGNAMG